MGDRDPGAAHFRSECRREAGVPIYRGKEQLGERAAVQGRTSTTKVRGLPDTAVLSRCSMMTVTTTESGTVPLRSRTCTAATPLLGFVKTVSFGNNVTAGALAGKVVGVKTTRRLAGMGPPPPQARTTSGTARRSGGVGAKNVSPAGPRPPIRAQGRSSGTAWG